MEEKIGDIVPAKRRKIGDDSPAKRRKISGDGSGETLPPLPWLLMVSDVEGEEVPAVASLSGEEVRAVASLSGDAWRRTRHTVRMPPEIRGMQCRGSAGGWLVAFRLSEEEEEEEKEEEEARLTSIDAVCFNPFTGSKLRLPRMIPHYFDKYTRFILLLDPQQDSSSSSVGIAAVAALCPVGIALWRRGEESWTEVEIYIHRYDLHDAIFYKGSLYIVDECGSVAAVDYLSGSNRGCFLDPGVFSSWPGDNHSFFLVESCNGGGHLLLVWWDIVSKKMKLYRLKPDNKHWHWDFLNSPQPLEEEAIFVGINQSISLSTRDYPHLTPNTIYFSCLYPTFYCPDPVMCNTGLYHLQDQSIRPIHHPCQPCNPWMPPISIWLLPSSSSFSSFMSALVEEDGQDQEGAML